MLKGLAALLFLFGLGQAKPEQAFSLIWKPKQGQVSVYDLTFESREAGGVLVSSTTISIRIRGVDPNGDYTTETSYSNSSVTTDGKREVVDSQAVPTIAKFNAKGGQISKPEDAGEDDLTNTVGDLLEFKPPEKPVKTGQKWIKTTAGKPASTTEYTLLGVEKGRARITFVYREIKAEHPATGRGAFVLDAIDASIVSADAILENVRVEGEDAPATHTMRLTRKSPPK